MGWGVSKGYYAFLKQVNKTVLTLNITSCFLVSFIKFSSCSYDSSMIISFLSIVGISVNMARTSIRSPFIDMGHERIDYCLYVPFLCCRLLPCLLMRYDGVIIWTKIVKINKLQNKKNYSTTEWVPGWKNRPITVSKTIHFCATSIIS